MFLGRYSVECDPGQILSYSVHSFDLENRVNCSSGEECVDWVEVTYHHLGQKERFCGARELGQLHLVGHNKISFEFVSNRRTEAGGFLYFVQCFDEDITDQDTAVTESCSKPPGSQPRRIMVQIAILSCYSTHIAVYSSCHFFFHSTKSPFLYL